MENKVTADYLDKEGCLHCGICGKRKQMKVSLMGFEHLKRFKAAEIAKTEAENLEIVRIIRAMDMSIPELEAFKKRMKTELPGRVEIQKEETKADDESGKNETEEENNY